MTDTERELLFAMARFMLDGKNRAEVETAIVYAERDRRCPFDGAILPCPHHSPAPGSPMAPLGRLVAVKDPWKP